MNERSACHGVCVHRGCVQGSRMSSADGPNRVAFLQHLGHCGRHHGDAAGRREKDGGDLRRQFFQRLSRRSKFLQSVRRRQAEASRPSPPLREAPPLCKRVRTLGVTHTGPTRVSETFHIAEVLLQRMTRAVGAEVLRHKLEAWSWQLGTTFTGAMIPEIAAKCLRKASIAWLLNHSAHSGQVVFPALRWGCAADINPKCQALVRHVFGETRCMFSDVMLWVSQSVTPEALRQQPPEGDMLRSSHCCVHKCFCPLPSAETLLQGFLDVEVAGPPCPPWSRMGKRLGTEDPRFLLHQVWVMTLRRRRPRIAIFENVDAYPVSMLVNNFADMYDIAYCKVDPRNFGIAMSRSRVYAILLLRGAMKWTTTTPLQTLLAHLGAQPVMQGVDYFVDPDVLSHRVLSGGEKTRLRQYECLPAGHRLKDAPIWDLHQSTKRARGSLRDGSLPTLTLACSSLFRPSRRDFLSPRQALRAMGFPMSAEDCRACDMEPIDFDSLGILPSDLSHMAGNGMHIACVLALMLVAIVFVEPVWQDAAGKKKVWALSVATWDRIGVLFASGWVQCHMVVALCFLHRHWPPHVHCLPSCMKGQ